MSVTQFDTHMLRKRQRKVEHFMKFSSLVIGGGASLANDARIQAFTLFFNVCKEYFQNEETNMCSQPVFRKLNLFFISIHESVRRLKGQDKISS